MSQIKLTAGRILLAAFILVLQGCGHQSGREYSLLTIDDVEKIVPESDGSMQVHCKDGTITVYDKLRNYYEDVKNRVLCENKTRNSMKTFFDFCLQNEWAEPYSYLVKDLMVKAGYFMMFPEQEKSSLPGPLKVPDKFKVCRALEINLKALKQLSLSIITGAEGWDVDLNPLNGLLVSHLTIEMFGYPFLFTNLRKLPDLQYLTIDGGFFHSFKELSVGFEKLKSLHLIKAGFNKNTADWQSLGFLTDLEELEVAPPLLSQEYIPDISFLAKLRNLKKLTLGNSPLGAELNLLLELPKLEEFSCQACNIFDLTPIKNMKSLKKLSLVRNAHKLTSESCPVDGTSAGVREYCLSYQ